MASYMQYAPSTMQQSSHMHNGTTAGVPPSTASQSSSPAMHAAQLPYQVPYTGGYAGPPLRVLGQAEEQWHQQPPSYHPSFYQNNQQGYSNYPHYDLSQKQQQQQYTPHGLYSTGTQQQGRTSSSSMGHPLGLSPGQQQAFNEPLSPFLGAKERRRSSVGKRQDGDYLNACRIPALIKFLAKYGDRDILFADMMIKINKRNKMQDRILLITEQAVYNIDPSGYKMKRRILIRDIGAISLSKLPDNFFCLHVPSEYDYLMVSAKKTEIVTLLASAWERYHQPPTPIPLPNAPPSQLPILFANAFEYRLDSDVYREIAFNVVDGGISTQIFSKKRKNQKK